MRKRFVVLLLALMIGEALCACGSSNQNNDTVVISETVTETGDSLDEIYDDSESPELEIGDLALVESSATIEDYSDIGMGIDCNFSFVVENNSGITLTSISVNCSILDADGNILGTSDAWIDSEIPDGIKATVSGFFYLDDYPDAAMIKAYSGYYETDGDNNVDEVGYLDEEKEATIIYLDELLKDNSTDSDELSEIESLESESANAAIEIVSYEINNLSSGYFEVVYTVQNVSDEALVFRGISLREYDKEGTTLDDYYSYNKHSVETSLEPGQSMKLDLTFKESDGIAKIESDEYVIEDSTGNWSYGDLSDVFTAVID